MSKEAHTHDPRADAATPTAAAPAQLATLPRALMIPGKNVRTHFDAAWIQELAADLKARGILQPLLVRPLPASRLQETFEDTPKGAPRPTHEIVDGECRWRAGGLIDLADYPVLIRPLSDVEVVQVQLVASLKRRNLHPLEEAEGFERLLKDHKLTHADVAASIDKSESYVYKSLKLLELTPECRDELYAGKLTQSTALLVARAPDYLQAKVAKDIMTMGQEGEPMSYRQAVRHIQQHYMLQLAHAVFDIKDASLVAKAGSCATCAKNSGANGDMFEDVKDGDTCTDPKCFDAKKVAHFGNVAKAAQAKGQTVIQGKEAKELIAYEGATPTGYRLLDNKDYINSQYTSLRKMIGKDAPTPVPIIDPFTKMPVEALPIEVAEKLIKQADRQKKADKNDAEPSKEKLEYEFSEQWKQGALRQIGAALLAGKMQTMTVDVARHIALALARTSGGDIVGEILGLGQIARSHALEDFIKTCPADKVAPTLLILLLDDELDRYTEKDFPATQLLAKETGVDLDAVKDQVKAEMKEAAAARKAAAEAKANKTKPAAPAKPATKPKKTSAADAKAGISKALSKGGDADDADGEIDTTSPWPFQDKKAGAKGARA
jgi:ParB/RepB/Spo0J family partition protein